jgi:hypothetical protein
MKQETTKISSEDVLNAFAVEPSHDGSTLERYLRNFPQYAIELAHLSQELSRPGKKETKLSEKDQLAIDNAWKQYSTSSTVSPVNVLASLTVLQLRDLAGLLDIPRQILTAFREHKVIVSSIPQGFLARLACGLNTTVDEIKHALSAPIETSFVRSHKADEKPVAAAPATFEQLLIDAQVPAEKREKLMSEGN